MNLILSVLAFVSTVARAEVDVHLFPQLHQPMGQTYATTEPLLRDAIVESQVDILNGFYARRDRAAVVFAEGHNRTFRKDGTAVPLLKNESLSTVRAVFEASPFPVAVEQLSDRQKRLLFTAGGPGVALALGWIEEIALTESTWSQFRTLGGFIFDGAKMFCKMFGPGRRAYLAGDVPIENPMMSKTIFDVRERKVLERLVTYARSKALRPGAEIYLVFGYYHTFPQAAEFDVRIEILPNRIAELMDRFQRDFALKMEERMAACQSHLETLPADASPRELAKAMRTFRRENLP